MFSSTDATSAVHWIFELLKSNINIGVQENPRESDYGVMLNDTNRAFCY